MSTLVAVLNQKGAALAADSAGTFTDGDKVKIYNEYNKIYMLSNDLPVGIMNYNYAGIMGIGVDVIIREYKKYLKKNKFPKLIDYAYDFLRFLENNKRLFPEKYKYAHFDELSFSYLWHLKDSILRRVDEEILLNGSLTQSEIEKLAIDVITEQYNKVLGFRKAYSVSKKRRLNDKEYAIIRKTFNKIYLPTLSQNIEFCFEKFPVSNKLFHALGNFIYDLFLLDNFLVGTFTELSDDVDSISFKFNEPLKNDSDYTINYFTGIIFVGYGEREIFPSIYGYKLEGLYPHGLKFTEYEKIEITHEKYAAIVPFAQTDVVQMFIEGIGPEYKRFFETDTEVLFNNNLKKLYSKYPFLKENEGLKKDLDSLNFMLKHYYLHSIQSIQKREYYAPILDMIKYYSKAQLSKFANLLVDITSYRRHFSSAAESVGGPTDVAIISKDDGFKWIKTKE